MKVFIENYSLENIKIKLAVLYILNVTDIIFTLLLLDTGLFIEANIIMAKAVQNPLSSFLLKIVLPAVLLIFIYFRMKKATSTQLVKSNFIVNVAILLYGLINICHLICCIYGVMYMF